MVTDRFRLQLTGSKNIFFGCEADDENKVHMIVEMPSIETAKKFMKNPEIKQKRVQAGVILDSQVVIPLADWRLLKFLSLENSRYPQ